LEKFDKSLKGSLYFHLAFCMEKLSGDREQIKKYYQYCLEYIPNHGAAHQRLAILKGK